MGTYQSGVALTDEEEDKIMAFLNTLTGEYQGKTLTNVNVQKQNTMIAANSNRYECPRVEIVNISVERGFAYSTTLEGMYGTEDSWD